jgi:glycosyltransferase involved in cell wall biosynthesis
LPPSRPPRLLYLVSEDWYFLSHRLPMARAAQSAGYEVHVATRVADGAAAITAEGFKLHPITWRRGSTNPLQFLAAVVKVRRLYRDIAPDLVHQVALWPSVVGSLAGLELPMARLSALAGLGYAFTSQTVAARIVRGLLRVALRIILQRPNSTVLVQNPDDRAAMLAIGIAAEHLFLIPGSGVDTDALTPLPEPEGEVTAAYVGRLLDDKGVRTLVRAHELLAEQGRPLRLLIAGEPDPANPASIPAQTIEDWKRRPGMIMLGRVAEIRDVWAAAHIAVLPSRREGLPKTLLEAAACGRAIVATDVPGCREIAVAGENALLVPPDDPVALADALARMAADPVMRRRFGAAGRRLVEEKFSANRVGSEIVTLYNQLLRDAPSPRRQSASTRASA